ncbi:hypothetical protein SUGI_0286740 [Cryptomeria japonica]|nr:hypothetical protein SUGI_0286740 [Cryptomeria japonica]
MVWFNCLRSLRWKLHPLLVTLLKRLCDRNFKNVKVVSNRMVFDIHGNLVGFEVHEKFGSNNGLESDANGASVVKDRTNVLLLGDHIGNIGMFDGLDYENCISIAFSYVLY